MRAKRKQIELTLTVSVPAWMSKPFAKRELRSLINDGCGWHPYGPEMQEVNFGTIKVRKLK